MGIPTTPPSGFRDFPPEDCARRILAAETISRVYRSFGFSQIATPAAEDLGVLTGKGAGETEKLIFKILKRGEKLDSARAGGELADLGLRFDLTLPLARFFVRHAGQLPKPFKAFQIGPVWRAERPQKGRYREFYQCDADIIGSESPLCEVEVIQAILAAFRALGVEGLTVLVNDRRLLYSLLGAAGIPPDKQGKVCVALDKLDKTEPETVWGEVGTLVGAEPAGGLRASLSSDDGSAALKKKFPELVSPLEEIKAALDAVLGGTAEIRISPILVRGFDYYTGPVFEFRHPNLAGSVGGGGRYDHLTEKFGGQKVPACGGSIGFERLMLLLAESGKGPEVRGPKACVTVFSDELRGASLTAAARLREAGWDVDVYAGTGKLKAQFKYADLRRAELAVVIGPDEAAAGKVRVKDLKTGEERLETLEALSSPTPPHTSV